MKMSCFIVPHLKSSNFLPLYKQKNAGGVRSDSIEL